MSGGHVWRAALDQLRREMTRAQFDTWLRGTQLADAEENGAAVLHVRSTFARELLETRYRARIEAAIAHVTGQPCQLRVVVGTPIAADEDAPTDVAAPAVNGHGGVAQVSGRQTTRSRAAAHTAQISTPRAVRTPYGGPTLFTAEEALDDSLAPGARHPAVAPARRRPSEGVRGVPSPQRVRAVVGRSNRPAATTGRPVLASPSAAPAAEEVSIPREEPDPLASAAQPFRGALEPAAGKARDESDGYGAMSEQGDPRGTTGSMPLPRLNHRYTFSTFIVGSGNRLAHAASLAVADAPGQAYNPLFLYGGVGLGKTHLLHALGHKMLEMALSVLYVSSETFTNEIINAIRYRTTDEFRAKYRSVDVLLVDDIQFIAGKDSTEEEFFHTFNSLYEMSKQIVICSDRPPKAIVSLEERLRSRFEWGLIADIQPPDLETRVAILRAKADLLGRVVPDDVVTYIASRVQSNIRELEGSFNRLLAFAELQGLPLTVETAKAALASIASDGRQRRVSLAEVLAAVAEFYRIPEDDLRGKQRDKHIVVPRQVAMYIMRQETEASLLEIGQSLGGRDHSTVLHGCEKITRAVNENTSLRKEVLAIRQQLLG
ncbi:MAG TPA: chromosomal replication initiator protein DnaA [Ktedonobacterales bacterium]